MSNLFKFKTINLEGLPEIKGVLKDFSPVKRIGDSNKFFSTDLKKKLAALSSTEPLSDTIKALGLLQFSVAIKAGTSYERIRCNADMFRLLIGIERGIRAATNATPIGFETYFSDSERSVKTRFYFVNFSLYTDGKAIDSDLSKNQAQKINESIKSRMGNFNDLSIGDFTSKKIDTSESELALSELEEHNTLESKADKLSALLLDPFYKASIQRALKGLDSQRAKTLMDVLNGITSFSEINNPQIELPQKHQKQAMNKSCKKSELDSDIIDDILS